MKKETILNFNVWDKLSDEFKADKSSTKSKKKKFSDSKYDGLCDNILPSGLEKQWDPAWHFKPVDFVRSATATRLSIDNSLYDVEYWKNIIWLVRDVLEPVRLRVGLPIFITSGYRSEKLNRIVGGAANSFHLYGRAVDILCSDMSKLTSALLAVNAANLKDHKATFIEYIDHRSYVHIAI